MVEQLLNSCTTMRGIIEFPYTLPTILQNHQRLQHITSHNVNAFRETDVQMIASLFNGLVKTDRLVVFLITRHHIKGLLCSREFVGDKAFQSDLPETTNDLNDTIAEVTTGFTLDMLRHV
jgi:hypothetical protein